MAVNDSDVEQIVRRAYTLGFTCGFDAGKHAGREMAGRARIETYILIGALAAVVGLVIGMGAP